MIKRSLTELIVEKINKNKAIIIIGARQVGKTTLLKTLFSGDDECLWLNADEYDVQNIFETPSSSRFKVLFAKYKTVVIDEAQRIKDIGIKLKLITDELPDIQLIATGSSSFELANKINEPLTGRKWEYHLYPISYGEMLNHHGAIEENRLLHHRLIYGYYPDVVTNHGAEKEVLKQLSDSYLYKDILMSQNIKKPDKLLKLLQAIAFQIGNQVSYNELSRVAGLDNQTVEKYINLLEQVYIIFRLNSFSRNLRKELTRSKKIYFYDNGIRNALIANFSEMEMRDDRGGLWENFLISERKKSNNNNNVWCNSYFWRTKDQQEIDYIEEIDGNLNAYEFKWSSAKKARISKTFTNAYPDSEFQVITRDNFSDFISQ